MRTTPTPARPTHCTRCAQAFLHREIPTERMQGAHTVVDVLCYTCAGIAPPRFFVLTEEDRVGSRLAMLDARAHPERYVGWHAITNVGLIPQHGAAMPTASDVTLAVKEVAS